MITQKSDENEQLAIYKNSKSYQEIVKNKYNIKNPNYLYDERILLLIFAYEWFDIPKMKIYDKVSYNPYITTKDFKKLNTIYQNYSNNLLLSFLPIGLTVFLIKRRFLNNKFKSFKRNWKFYLLIGGIVTMVPPALWYLYFLPKMNKNIVEDPQLRKYLELDVDKEKIRLDLLNYNIIL